MTKQEIKEFQDLMNDFTSGKKKYLLGVKPIPEDGVAGPMTRIRAETCKWYLGFGKTRKAPDGKLTPKFKDALQSPKGKFLGLKVRRAGGSRRARQRAARRVVKVVVHGVPGVGMFDGKPVAKCLIPVLTWCRRTGHNGEKWHGFLNSGWRSILYSISLCFRICGRSSCPGRCAGAGTNHVGKTRDRCAADVSDYQRFERIVAHCPHDPKIRNELDARDPVHFSPNGH